ncbi:MAG: 3-hydroxyacyl-CoA dehydrogenase/enoyl-CoA hydratase family protein [Thermoleophilia bacterium]|nr:3-hydroxyacyl-CoA dehydrogenase/enoyl-CoA hydratase family protein [Thermoleophilia bacterium]
MLVVRRAAVLGAGRMGTAVAAHLANAGIPTLLLDLVPTELTEEEKAKGLDLSHPSVRNRLATSAVETAAKSRPAAFAHPSRIGLITPGNVEDDLPKLASVDWVIEAVVEKLDVKKDILARIAPYLGPKTIVSTNSSGLSVNAMAEALPPEVKRRFLGSHFFFPPRYMYLLELIPGNDTDPEVVEGLKDFAELRLGKGVVISRDRPNFVANRIGIFSTVYAINTQDKYGLTIEEVDAASGRALARSVTATYGTSNLAGTDVLAYAVSSHYEAAPDDEMREMWRLPEWILEMLRRGYLGEKTGGSFFREKRTLVIDPATLEYRPWQDPRYSSIAEANKISDPVERVKKFISFDDPAARFGWDLLAATWVYAANRIPEICDDIATIDRAMRWGYAWELGPFELWDGVGVRETVRRMLDEGRAVPEWVVTLAESDYPYFYKKERDQLLVWGPGQTEHKPLPPRPRIIVLKDLKAAGKTLDECEDASLIDLGDRVACVEFHTKANIASLGALTFIEKAIQEAGRDYDALVIGNQGSNFSAGADLRMMSELIAAEKWDEIDQALRTAQRVSMAIKYAPIPVVAAPFGRVLGGGLEVCLHCHHVQADAEVAMGLVETSVGLVPSAGGIKEMLVRATARSQGLTWPFPFVRQALDAISQAKVSSSAWEAFDLGYLREGDRVTMNRESLIYAAKRAALALLEGGWQPPIPAKVKVMGRDGVGTFRAVLDNIHGGGFMTDHDRYLAGKVAWVLSGGDVETHTEVDEEYLLALERKAFLEVCRTPKSVERINHMLATGKPLRN